MREKSQLSVADDPAGGFTIEPPGRWVTGFKAPPPDAGEPSEEAPTDHLRIDHQLFPKRRSRYQRHAQRLNTAQGVQAMSQVSLDFDPATERLELHSVRVWRDGEPTEHADEAKFKLIQRESNLERQIYDGRMSALLLLEDVRVGDVIDIAFTRTLCHPVLASHFHACIPTAYPIPVGRWTASVLLPAEDSTLHWRQPEGLAPPEERELKGGWSLHRWRVDELAALESEPNAPIQFATCPVLEFSDFAGWPEVAAWVAEIWGAAKAPDALREVAKEIASAEEGEVARADRALAFVRDEIRYLGLEEGLGSLQPCPPEDVMRRRFGDCKDKSLLLCLLFRLLKIPASPMLVHTVARETVEGMLPSPSAFDHVIVCAKIGGSVVWIDPTRSSLSKTVAEIPPPGFGRALQVSAKAKGLKRIPDTPMDAALLVVNERFVINHPDKPVELEVTLTASGYEAEHLREIFGSIGHAKMRELREAQMREIYPKSRAVGDWSNELAVDADTVSLREHYEIEDFALKADDGGRAAPFGPSSLRGRFPGVPDEAERDAPWALPYPCRIRHEVQFDLPFELPEDGESHQVDSESFGFTSGLEVGGRSLHATYRYWSKADRVLPEQLETFRADVDRMTKGAQHLLHFPLSRDARKTKRRGGPADAEHRRRVKRGRQTEAQRINGKMLSYTVIAAVVAGFFLMRLFRDDPPPREYETLPPRPSAEPPIPEPPPVAPAPPSPTRSGTSDASPSGRVDLFDDDSFKPLFENDGDLGGDDKPATFEGSLLSSPPGEEGEDVELAPKYRSLDLTP